MLHESYGKCVRRTIKQCFNTGGGPVAVFGIIRAHLPSLIYAGGKSNLGKRKFWQFWQFFGYFKYENVAIFENGISSLKIPRYGLTSKTDKYLFSLQCAMLWHLNPLNWPLLKVFRTSFRIARERVADVLILIKKIGAR